MWGSLSNWLKKGEGESEKTKIGAAVRRKYADLSLIFNEFETAYLNYKECVSEFKSSNKNHAGILEMLAISSFLSLENPNYKEIFSNLNDSAGKYLSVLKVEQSPQSYRLLMRLFFISSFIARAKGDYQLVRDLFTRASDTVCLEKFWCQQLFAKLSKNKGSFKLDERFDKRTSGLHFLVL